MTAIGGITVIENSCELFSNADKDAVEIGDLYRKARSSVADSVRYSLDAGARLLKKKAELDRGEWLPWLEANADVLDMDITCTPQRLMKAAVQFGASAEFIDEKAIEVSRTIWGHNVRGTQGTGENEWFTPGDYIKLARAVLGGIDLDPATHPQAQTIIQAAKFFTKADDGLAREWHGRIWLNPPYAQPLIAHFVSKLCAELKAEHVKSAIMLTHNYTDTAWFQEAAHEADAICFTRGRVKFYELDGTIAAPTQGQAFFYFGGLDGLFAATFKPIGFVMVQA